MFANERRDIILRILNEHRSVTVAELTERFGVSIETVRRDLDYLEKAQKLQRVHGGAIIPNRRQTFDIIEKRLKEHADEKRYLTELAVKYIDNGDMIFVDSGSTAVAFALSLKNSGKQIKVATYSSDVFQILSDCPNIHLILSGGMYLPTEKAFCGAIAYECMQKMYADKCFLFPSAISLKHGTGDFIYELISLQKLIAEQTNKLFILADSSKFETTGNFQITESLSGCTLITDNKIPDSLYDLYSYNNIDLIKQ